MCVLLCCCGCRYTVGQKFGKHIDDSVEVEGATGCVTGYTLLIYLSGTPPSASGPIDVSAPKAPAPSSSRVKHQGQTAATKGRRQTPAPTAATAGPVVQPDTSAVQQLLGGETVFYGEVVLCCTVYVCLWGVSLLKHVLLRCCIARPSGGACNTGKGEAA